MSFAVVPKHWKAGFDTQLLQDWITLFRQVVFAVVSSDLAEAWMKQASQVGRSLLISNEHYRATLKTSAL